LKGSIHSWTLATFFNMHKAEYALFAGVWRKVHLLAAARTGMVRHFIFDEDVQVDTASL
jgi:hypothetical protein